MLLGGRGDAAVRSERRAERAEETHFNFSSGIYSWMDNLQANVLFRKCILLARLPATLVFRASWMEMRRESRACWVGHRVTGTKGGWIQGREG